MKMTKYKYYENTFRNYTYTLNFKDNNLQQSFYLKQNA